jgi:pimeloyl-ACP methyl ester carboxylesterase
LPPPIVLVHGAFCGGWIFDRFRTPFEAAGHTVHAPDLRGHGADEAPGVVVGVSMADYAADIARLCEGLSQPPILIGHSMGGLVAQMAASRTPVSALVVMASSPPWGAAISSLEEGIAAFGLNLLGPIWARAVPPDRTLAYHYSLNRMGEAERAAAFARLRPESGRAMFETLNWWLDTLMTTRLNLARLKSTPALALVGEADAIHPPATARMNARTIGADFQQLPGMSHWLPDEPGWERVADVVLKWLEPAPVAAG